MTPSDNAQKVGVLAPPMKTCRVTINFSTGDRSSSWALSSKNAGSPESTLTQSADEIARLAELFGCGDDVEAAVREARQRVRDWREGTPNAD